MILTNISQKDHTKIIQQQGQIAQLVEQRTENPCVGGSIPPLATTNCNGLRDLSKYLFKP